MNEAPVTKLSAEDLHALKASLPEDGMYDNFQAPDAGVLVGDRLFLNKLNVPSYGVLFNNFWMVHQDDAAALIDACSRQFQQLWDFRGEDDSDLATGALIGTWSHPQSSYCLVGTFSDLGQLSPFRQDFPYVKGWHIAKDAVDNSIEEIWAYMDRAQYHTRENYRDAAWLSQQLILPSALWARLERTVQKDNVLNDYPTDEWLVLRYLVELAREGQWMQYSLPTLQAMVQEHDLKTSIGMEDGTVTSSPKSKM